MTEALRTEADAADQALMRRVQADDAEAFGVLYDRFSERAYGVVSGIARDRGDADDLVQAAFVALWRGRARYDPAHGTVGGWIMAAVADTVEESLAGPAHLRTALGALPPAQREVIALAYFGELSAPEIAERLSLPVGTVKGRMRLGLDQLRDDTEA